MSSIMNAASEKKILDTTVFIPISASLTKIAIFRLKPINRGTKIHVNVCNQVAKLPQPSITVLSYPI